MTTRVWLVMLTAMLLVGCGDGDEGRSDHRFATPTPSAARTPCEAEPTSCASNAGCRRHADCGASDGICVASTETRGECFCRFTGPCRFREAVGRCDGVCAPGLSFCISARSLNPTSGSERGCLCEPPTPTPDPMSTPRPDPECSEADGSASSEDEP